MVDSTTAQRFEAMVLPHMDSAFNVARWMTHHDQNAEDVVQEAYMRAFKFFPGYRGGDARAWLLAIVRNTFYTWYQQNHEVVPEAVCDEEMDSLQACDIRHDDNPEAISIRSENRRQVHRAIRGLRLEFREVVVLRELEELSYKEIAAIVGIPMGTVMSRLGRGRQQLAVLLASMNQEL